MSDNTDIPDTVPPIHCIECSEPTSTVIDSWGTNESMSCLMYECSECGGVSGVFAGTEGEPQPSDIELFCENRVIYDGLYGENKRVYDARRARRVELPESVWDAPDSVEGFSLSSGHRARKGEIVILPSEVYRELVTGDAADVDEEETFVPSWRIRQNIQIVDGNSETAESLYSHDTFEADYETHLRDLQRSIADAEHKIGERWTARILIEELQSFDHLNCEDELAAVSEAIQEILFESGSD